MALDANIVGGSGNTALVTTAGLLQVTTETDAATNPDNVGGVRIFGENDGGAITGTPKLFSPEVDADYRLRVGQDLIYDEEVFNYTAQNTGKHNLATTTMTGTFTAGNFTTNGSSITTANSGLVLSTYAFFPNNGTQTLSGDFEVAFSAQPQTNTFIEFGIGIASTALVAPADGVFFRLSSAGLQGIASNNGTETSTGVFPLANGAGTWVYTIDKKYQFICYNNATNAEFWVDDGTGAVLLGSIPLPSGQGRMSMAMGQQKFFKHRIVGGAAGGVIQGKLGAYNIRAGGSAATSTLSTQGNRILGSYQGLSGGAMGTMARVGTITTGNEANVTAAVPTTTTAALGSGLGGTFWETISLAVNTDGIIMSYQVPAGTVLIQGRRLVLRGIYLNSYVQTVLVGGPYIAEWFLAFGHTAVSLATTEAATTKAPRRIPAPFVQLIGAAAAVSTVIAQSENFWDLGDAPVYVNPGEFVQLCTRHIGTVGTSGTIVHRITPVYGWE
jgi:hypothetical protein